jgi:hypothetical protein
MSDIESANFSELAAGNSATPPNGWPEGATLIGQLTDCARELMGSIKREWNRSHPTLTSGGSANVQTLTFGVAPAAYVRGQVFAFVAGFTNTGPTTLNVNGLGTIAIQRDAAALTGGEIVAGRTYMALLDTTSTCQLIGSAKGGLIGTQTFATAGASTYTPTPGTNSVVVEVIGGGGGGGGAALTGAAQIAVGGAGAGGGYARKRITSAFSGVTVTVGAGGTGGTAGANNGTDGGTSSFGALVSATGGQHGNGDTAAAVPKGPASTNTGGTGASGDINIRGEQPWNMFSFQVTTAVVSQNGGAAPVYGARAPGVATGTGANGANGLSYGSGGTGGGNAASQGTGKSGGNGSDGLVVVWEYN